MTAFNLEFKQEISIFLDINGIEIFVGDDELPTKTLSIDTLIVEFIESRWISQNELCEIEDVIAVRDALQRGLDTLNSALENAV
jgi:hypothetical protein